MKKVIVSIFALITLPYLLLVLSMAIAIKGGGKLLGKFSNSLGITTDISDFETLGTI